MKQYLSELTDPVAGRPSTPSARLFRRRIVHQLISGVRDKTVAYITAQAGQGKTTLVEQFMQHVRADHTWYGLGQKDTDPVVLITGLFYQLVSAISNLERSVLQELISGGLINHQEPDRFATLLSKDLGNLLQGDFYLVLDDIHCLETSPASLAFLQTLIDKAPPRLHIFLVSRRSTELQLNPDETYSLINEDLALTRAEVADLYAELFKQALVPKSIQTLHRITEGWTMGALLIAQTLRTESIDAIDRQVQQLMSLKRGKLLDYFRDEVLSGLSYELRQAIYSLAWLENIPVGLASKLSGMQDMPEILEGLLQHNFFLRRLDAGKDIYGFHHLFQAYLRAQADRALGDNQRKDLLNRAAEWFLDLDRSEDALGYYLRAENYDQAETVLRRVGLDMLATNRFVTLLGALEKIPESIIHDRPWLSYFLGAAQINTTPALARNNLANARETFAKDNDDLGELLATSLLITFHMAVDSMYSVGEKLMPRAIALFDTFADSLPVAARFQISSALIYGLCHFQARIQDAERYTFEIYRLAEKSGLDDALAGAAIAKWTLLGIAGEWAGCTSELERSFHLVGSPRVGVFNKMILFTCQANLLALKGDFEAYYYNLSILHRNIDSELIANTIVGPFFYIMDIDAAIMEGRYADASRYAGKGLDLPGAGATPHMQSQYLSYLAFLRAIEGSEAKAIEAAEASTRLRSEAGGRYFEIINSLIIGSAYTHLKSKADEAESKIKAAIEGSKELNESFIRAGAYAHRAILRLNSGRTTEALQDVQKCLSHLKTKGYVHFYCWTSRVMEEIIATAIQHGIEVDYALYLAQERLHMGITTQGKLIPQLFIKTLGTLQICIPGTTSITYKDFTPAQRELLALLVASPQQQLPQETIQTLLWPESPADTVRSKFDNLLSRLRKALDLACKPHSAKHYLVLEKGVLRLQNCRIDAVRFSSIARCGVKHARQHEFWQANNAFHGAHRRYQGYFMPGVNLHGDTGHFREDLHLLYLESVQSRIEILSKNYRQDEAIQIGLKAFPLAPTHEALAKSLYSLLSKSGKSTHALKIINKYKQALEQDGWSPTEIDDILEAFWSPSDS